MAMKKAASKAAGRTRAAVKKVAKKVVARKVRAKAAPIPKGYHIITPSIVVRGAAEAIEFYKKAFGAKELYRMPMPDGKLMHAEIKIGDSIVMVTDEFPNMGSSSPRPDAISSSLLLYTRDVDGLFERAVAAGAKPSMPVSDMFWGDRYAKVIDPYGHHWQLATRKENLTPREMTRRAAASMSALPPPQQGPQAQQG